MCIARLFFLFSFLVSNHLLASAMSEESGQTYDRSRLPEDALKLDEYKGFVRCKIPDSKACLLRAVSPEQHKGFILKLNFLYMLIDSYYTKYTTTSQSDDKDSERGVFCKSSDCFDHIVEHLVKIIDRLNEKKYVEEQYIINLYFTINAAIHELEKNSQYSLVLRLMYDSAKTWILKSFPINPLISYIESDYVITNVLEKPDTLYMDLGANFQPIKYLEQYFELPDYKKVREWINSKAGSKNLEKTIAQTEFNTFKNEVSVSPKFRDFDRKNNDIFIILLRWVEKLDARGLALIEKWKKIITAADIQSSQMAIKVVSPVSKKVDPDVAMAYMMQQLDMAKSSLHQKPKVKPAPKAAVESELPAKKISQSNGVNAKDLDLLKAEREAQEDARQAQLAETEKFNAEKNAVQRQRQEELAAQRAAEKAGRAIAKVAILERHKSWIDSLYEEQQKLSPFEEAQLVDASVFEGAANFDEACTELRAKGIYLGLGIHGNEKCVAMWKNQQGKNIMVWFDAPHGVQLKKGLMAGWSIALRKALGDSDRLLNK